MDDLASLKSILWSESRLEQRFVYFEHVTLPALRAQTDDNFQIAVLIADDMPQRHVERLNQLVADIPQITICAMPTLLQRDAAQQAITQLKDPQSDFVAHFRLDDDDAVAVDFIADVRRKFDNVAALMEANQELSLDYTHGFILSVSTTAAHGQLVHKRQWTPGQVIFLRQRDPRTIMHFPHFRLDKKMVTIIEPRPVMFVRSMNAFNDSGLRDFPIELPELSTVDCETLTLRFNISVGTFLKAALSVL